MAGWLARARVGGVSLRRYLTMTQSLSGESEMLAKAKERVTKLTVDPGNDIKLKLYALYKQVRCLVPF